MDFKAFNTHNQPKGNLDKGMSEMEDSGGPLGFYFVQLKTGCYSLLRMWDRRSSACLLRETCGDVL